MRLRRLLPVIAIVVFGGVPAALAVSADPFGAPETADPVFQPNAFFNEIAPFFGADANGNVLLGSIHRDAKSNDQFAVYERCGAGPVTWQRTVLTDSARGIFPDGLRVAANGTAMAVWRVTGGGVTTHYSAVRPPGGSWGAPQTLVSDTGVGFVQFALGDNGDAIALYADGNGTPGTYAKVRPAGGTWGAAETIAATTNDNRVAMSPTGAAVVVYEDSTPGYVFARYRPVGGPWADSTEVIRSTYQNALETLGVEFDGGGRAVVVAVLHEFDYTVHFNIAINGLWNADTTQTLNDDGNPPAMQYGLRRLHSIARHPNGLVATWTRQPSDQNTDRDVVVGRLSGTTWDLKIFDPPTGSLDSPRLAVDAAGEILLAADWFHGNVDDIHAAIAPSLIDTWPDLAPASPLASATRQFRNPFVAGGGSAFSLGWGLYDGSKDATEVISTKPAGAACNGGSTPTPTASATETATPSPSPDPLPLPSPTPSATPNPNPVPATPDPSPSAIADFTTLPKASTCVRGRKLTVRFKKPPKGYTVKTVTLKVNAKKVATVKGAKLKKPLYLRKLPAKPFTITVSIALTKGKGLTEKRRYTPCK